MDKYNPNSTPRTPQWLYGPCSEPRKQAGPLYWEQELLWSRSGLVVASSTAALIIDSRTACLSPPSSSVLGVSRRQGMDKSNPNSTPRTPQWLYGPCSEPRK